MPHVLSDNEKLNYLNVTDGLARVRGNSVLYKKMIRLFLDNDEFHAFEEHLASGNLKLAGDSMHTIKGISGNLSMGVLFQLSGDLMVEMRSGKVDMDKINSYREALQITRELAYETLNAVD